MPGVSSPARRTDLDWLRVGALGLLILTHVTYIYRTTEWRVHSEHAGLWGDLVVEALAPWRMSLVFFIGGAATRFMLASRDLPTFAVNRFLRLGVPFLMAVVLLVPPMWYLTDPLARGSSYIAYVARTPLHAHAVFGFHLPDLGHVWFLAYLLAYALAAGLAWRFAPASWTRIEASLGHLPIAALAVGVAALFVISDSVLKPAFGRTDMFLDDPAGHLRALPPFLLGLMFARSDSFWRKLQSARTWLTPLAVALMLAAVSVAAADTLSGHTLPAWQTGVADGLYGAAALLAILGWASKKLNHDSPQLRYLSDAIMPVYLLHQPVVVAAALGAEQAHLPLLLEYPLAISAALLIPLAIFHVVIRQVGPLRVLFGLKMNSRKARPVQLAHKF
ncbi:MAG: acyltransferase family protein [Hyphomonadaceae bacterium]